MGDNETLPAEELVSAFKALANPVRWQIMEWLRDPRGRVRPVGAHRRPLRGRGVRQSHPGQDRPHPVDHLLLHDRPWSVLVLVISTRIGKWTHYRRNDERLRQIGEAISGA
ncbi:MAG: hypothetical protein LKI24_05780 [Acidipropionibacterium sp.]|nr:hypothetical protein [Acidipropionibacterium sp.]